MFAQSMDLMLQTLQLLQGSHEYSDLKIVSGDQVFPVHKVIVCPRSRYFAASCKWIQDNNLKEEIVLEDGDHRVVALMIDYLYQMDYDDLLPSRPRPEPVEETRSKPDDGTSEQAIHYGPSFEALHNTHRAERGSFESLRSSHQTTDLESGLFENLEKNYTKKANSRLDVLRLEHPCEDVTLARLTINTLMYAMADKDEIDDLKLLAKKKFEAAVARDWQSQAFAHAAELAINTTPDSDQGLRSIVVRAVSDHPELLDYEEIQSLFDSENGMALALALSRVLIRDRAIRTRPLCTHCPSCIFCADL